MIQSRRFERIGVLLALVMSATALGMEIQQRLTRTAPPPAPKPPEVSIPTSEGELSPLPVPPGGKEILGKDGDLPHMQGFARGKKQYDLTVKRLVITPGEQSAIGEGIQGGTLLSPDGKPTVRFMAERATMNRQTNNLDIQGQVRVESVDPKNYVVFETRDMRWNAAQEKLECPNPVEVVQEGVLLRASRMTADVRLKKLSLDGNIYLEADADKVKQAIAGRESGAQKGNR